MTKSVGRVRATFMIDADILDALALGQSKVIKNTKAHYSRSDMINHALHESPGIMELIKY